MAINDAGSFVVDWTYVPANTVPASQLTATPGIYARLYNAAGPVANEFLVVANNNTDGQSSYPGPNHYNVGHNNHPVGMDAAGNFVVGWFESAAEVADRRLRMRAFTAAGTPRGDAFTITQSTSAFAQGVVGDEQFKMAMDANGDLAAAWGNPDPVPDTGGTVLGQRFVRADFDVQRSETQRSTVQYIDITFNLDAVDVAGLLNAGRLRLTRYDLTGTGTGTDVSLTGTKSVSGGTLTLDFGPAGLSDGYYVLEADLNGDGVYETAWRFYRMAGDMTGTGLNNYPGLMPGLILND